MKIFLAFYLFLFIAGTLVIDLYVATPARADEAPVANAAAPNEPANPDANNEPDAKPAPQNNAPVSVADALKLPPLPENLKASGRYQKWGVTKTRFNTTVGEIPGGTFLEFSNINATPLKAWFYSNGMWNAPVEVPPESILYFEGTLDGVNPGQLRVLQRYFDLLGRLDTPAPLVVEQPAAPAPAGPVNPYEAEYKALAKQWGEFQERVEIVTKQRDTAKGTARDRYINELRAMKQDEAALARKVNAIKGQYNDWKAKNPAPAAPAQVEKPASAPVSTLDPALAEKYRAELKRLEPEAKKLLP